MARWLVFGGASLFLLAVVAAGWAVWPRDDYPATPGEALQESDSRRSTPGGAAVAGLPAAGVYTYAASGHEEAKLEGSPGKTRTYPTVVAMAVMNQPPSCFTVALTLIEAHAEDTTYCVTADGSLRLDARQEHRRTGAMSEVTNMTCDEGTVYDPAAVRTTLSCQVSLSAGDAQLTGTLTGTTEATERVLVEVGGRRVEAVLVDLRFEVSGEITGSWSERTWFARDPWLPLRIERERRLAGSAEFAEHFELALTSLDANR